MKPFSEFLNEALIQYNHGAKFGQVVFLAGGGGSGKGLAIKKFLDVGQYRVLDVDAFKDSLLKLNRLTQKYPELNHLRLGDPRDLDTLHKFVKKIGLAKKQVDYLFAVTGGGNHLTNILFDETGKDMDTFSIIPRLNDVGYQPKDIHLTWVFTNFAEAVERNLRRGLGGGRKVPDSILLNAHIGAAKTMYNIVFQNKLPAGLDGSITVILNNSSETKVYRDASGAPIRNSRGEEVIEKFTYITLKKSGAPIVTEAGLLQKFKDWILTNAPFPNFVD